MYSGQCNCSFPDLYVYPIAVPGPSTIEIREKTVPVPVILVKEIEVRVKVWIYKAAVLLILCSSVIWSVRVENIKLSILDHSYLRYSLRFRRADKILYNCNHLRLPALIALPSLVMALSLVAYHKSWYIFRYSLKFGWP